MTTDPTHNMKRRVENGYEIVSIYYHKDWLYLLKVISSSNNEAYKIALTEICGYPAEEWIRIKEVVLNKQDNGDYIVDVWFRNPGKMFEEFLKVNKDLLDEPLLIEIGHGVGEYELGKTIYPVLELSRDVLEWCQRG